MIQLLLNSINIIKNFTNISKKITNITSLSISCLSVSIYTPEIKSLKSIYTSKVGASNEIAYVSSAPMYQELKSLRYISSPQGTSPDISHKNANRLILESSIIKDKEHNYQRNNNVTYIIDVNSNSLSVMFYNKQENTVSVVSKKDRINILNTLLTLEQIGIFNSKLIKKLSSSSQYLQKKRISGKDMMIISSSAPDSLVDNLFDKHIKLVPISFSEKSLSENASIFRYSSARDLVISMYHFIFHFYTSLLNVLSNFDKEGKYKSLVQKLINSLQQLISIDKLQQFKTSKDLDNYKQQLSKFFEIPELTKDLNEIIKSIKFDKKSYESKFNILKDEIQKTINKINVLKGESASLSDQLKAYNNQFGDINNKTDAEALLQQMNQLSKSAADQLKTLEQNIAKEQSDKEKAEKDKLAKEQAAKEKAEKDKLAKEQAAKEKAEKDKLAKEQSDKEKAEKDKLAKEQNRLYDTIKANLKALIQVGVNISEDMQKLDKAKSNINELNNMNTNVNNKIESTINSIISQIIQLDQNNKYEKDIQIKNKDISIMIKLFKILQSLQKSIQKDTSWYFSETEEKIVCIKNSEYFNAPDIEIIIDKKKNTYTINKISSNNKNHLIIMKNLVPFFKTIPSEIKNKLSNNQLQSEFKNLSI